MFAQKELLMDELFKLMAESPTVKGMDPFNKFLLTRSLQLETDEKRLNDIVRILIAEKEQMKKIDENFWRETAKITNEYEHNVKELVAKSGAMGKMENAKKEDAVKMKKAEEMLEGA